MQKNNNRLAQFCAAMGIPDFIAPWIDRFFEKSEIELILLLAQKPLLYGEIGDHLNNWPDELRPTSPQDWLNRIYKRGTINCADDGRYAPADFHTRFEIWAIFEGWQNIPAPIREQLNAWELSFYEKEHRPQIDGLKEGRKPDPDRIYPEYVLLEETDAILDRAGHIYLWPCNCRAMVKQCNNTVYTCLRFDNDRGLGWEISKSRAREIVRDANAKGLMQSAEVAVAPDGSIRGALCNCCADCCYPHQLAQRVSAQKLWPLTRYLAHHLEDRCTRCGRCVRRCPFQAISLDKTMAKEAALKGEKNRNKPAVCFDTNLCRGCGVCSTGCPAEGIEMLPLNAEFKS
jgi:Pyruvate/2-oxoacid:ferredoxin oxidoreductase delta subunit